MQTQTRTSHDPLDERDDHVELPGGRRLSYATFGAAPGAPLVVVLDGSGSRGLARAAAKAAGENGIRLVAPDRPGFGASTRGPGRRITDWPADHAALLDALGADRAGILGQSAGTPYALVAAAALPERVTAVAVTGAVSPLGNPQALSEVSDDLRRVAKLARRAPWLLRLLLQATGRQARRSPDKAARKLAKDLPPADAELLSDPRLWAIHRRASGEILSQARPFVEEVRTLAAPWGFEISDVRVPVAFWSGDMDTTHPTSHSRRLSAQLPTDAPVHVIPGAGTIGLMPHYGAALRFACR